MNDLLIKYQNLIYIKKRYRITVVMMIKRLKQLKLFNEDSILIPSYFYDRRYKYVKNLGGDNNDLQN